MKKYVYLLAVFSFLFSCEKDDICIDETTPHLIIRFYDKIEVTKVLEVVNLKVEVVDSLDNIIQITSGSLDSITLPLNVDLNYTKIYLTKNATETSAGIEDSFILNYTKDEVYVSRSCGFKTIYDDASKSEVSTNWIENISIDSEKIDNEHQAHIKIFHENVN